MAFKKLDIQQIPPRQWLLIGYPDAGKSTFATQMKAPLLTVDADHRFAEVARLATGDVYKLSDDPTDNVDAEKVVARMRENMTGSGVKTVVVDSLTSIITPLVVEAMIDNDAGRNKNRVASFKPKALSVRLLQDGITNYGTDVLWIAHLRRGMDGQAKERETTTISVVELARLRRSLNMELRIIQEGNRRGVKVDWARRGRSGLTLWDDTGVWKGMAEKIETAVYGGLTLEEQEIIESSTPKTFGGSAAAIAWGFEQGCFRDAVHAQNAYDKVRSEKAPKSAQEMWGYWIEDVQRRKQEDKQTDNPFIPECEQEDHEELVPA